MSATPVTIVGVLKHDDGSIEHVTLTGFDVTAPPPIGPSHPDVPPPPIGPSHPVEPPPGPDQQ